ncbi:MAG TPA: hypothetical protein VIC62_22340, partial [Nakamurella sp.]
MTATIGQSMSQLGFAPVIAFLTPEGRAAPSSRVVSHFTPELRSTLAAAAFLSAAEAGTDADVVAVPAVAEDVPAARVFPHLGIVYGTVEPAGLAALKASREVRAVKPAAQLSLIRPMASARPSQPSGATWGLQALQIAELWQQGWTG